MHRSQDMQHGSQDLRHRASLQEWHTRLLILVLSTLIASLTFALRHWF